MKILITDIFLRKTFDVVNILLKHYDKKDFVFLSNNPRNLTKLKCTLFYQSSNLFLLRKNENFNSDLKKISLFFSDEKLVYLPIEEDTTLLFLSFLQSNTVSSNFFYLLPETDTFLLSRDKEKLNAFCERNAIPCPKLITHIDFKNNNFSLPVIVKPKIGSGSKRIFYIETEKDLLQLNFDSSQNFIQEKLPSSRSVEGGFYLCDNGEILSFYSHKRIRTFPKKGGVTVFSEATNSEQIKIAGQKIIEKLNWSGLIMIEFIFDERDEKYKLIEINPRMWGSILLSEECGSNLLQNYVELVKGNSIKESYFSKTYIRWIFPYDFLFFLKNPSNPFRFFSSPKHTIHVNFTYSSFFRSFFFLLMSYFNFAKILHILKK